MQDILKSIINKWKQFYKSWVNKKDFVLWVDVSFGGYHCLMIAFSMSFNLRQYIWGSHGKENLEHLPMMCKHKYIITYPVQTLTSQMINYIEVYISRDCMTTWVISLSIILYSLWKRLKLNESISVLHPCH